MNMSTLAEIEEAAAALPAREKEELIHFLMARLQRERMGRVGQAGNLSDFAGVLRLPEDPLVWQHRIREEWG